MKAVLPRPFNLASKRIFGLVLTGLMISIVILLVLRGMFLTEQFTKRGQKDSRQANSINLSRSFASEIDWTPTQLTTPPQERHNNLQDIGNQLENELRQAKQTIEELTAEHTAVKYKLDGDKRLFKIGLKSQQDLRLSELNERSASQKLQVAQEGLVTLKAKQVAILRKLEEERQEIARFNQALGDSKDSVNPIVKYKREPDHDAIALARQLNATPPSERDEKKLDELRKLLNESFTIKHEVYEQRLAKLSEEVAKTKETLDKRKSNQTEIIDRRMSELLGAPDTLSWDYEQRLSGFTAPATTYMELPPGSTGNSSVIPPAYGNYNGFVVPPNQASAIWIPPSGAGSNKSTPQGLPVYNPYQGQNSNVMPNPVYSAPYVLGVSPYYPPYKVEVSDFNGQQVSTVRESTTKNEIVFLPNYVWTLSERIIDFGSALKPDILVTNPLSEAAVEALRILLDSHEAVWAAKYKEYEDTLSTFTSQIAEIEKLKSREWREGEERLREAVEIQMKSLNKQKRDVSSYINWMRDFKQNKYPELFDQSKLKTQKSADEPKDKSTDEPVPTEAK